MTEVPGHEVPGHEPADVGLANERTALAWQRTALSLVGGSAIVARLSWSELGLVALVPVLVTVVLALWVFLESNWRYAHDAGTRPRGRSRGGRGPLFLTLCVVVLAGTELFALR